MSHPNMRSELPLRSCHWASPRTCSTLRIVILGCVTSLRSTPVLPASWTPCLLVVLLPWPSGLSPVPPVISTFQVSHLLYSISWCCLFFKELMLWAELCPSKFLCWSPNPNYLRMLLYLETESFKRDQVQMRRPSGGL